MSTMPRSALVLVLIAGAIAMTAPTVAAATRVPALPCESIELSVALTAGGPVQHRVAGRLCAPRRAVAATLQALLPGATYNGTYWDFPLDPRRHSYLEAMRRSGHAVLDVDRIGTGLSSRPAAAAVTFDANVYVAHQLVQAARRGKFGGIRFERVTTVGHSLGSAIALVEAARYDDVDGLILTGLLPHAPPVGAPALIASLHPASLEPRFHAVPLGYVTNRPGTRGDVYYHRPGARAEVIALDEQTKDTAAPLELAGVIDIRPATRRPRDQPARDRRRLVRRRARLDRRASGVAAMTGKTHGYRALARWLAAAMATALIFAAAASATGPIDSRGAFTCDFQMPADLPLDQVAPVIERDRIYMARQPGMLNKHLPIRSEPVTGAPRSGGRYLFDSYDHARAYLRFVGEDFVLDGVPFLDRPIFIGPDCHAWSTIGAHDFADIHDSRAVMRTERWSVPETNQRPALNAAWPRVRDAAAARGLSSVWLLYSKPERLVTLVYYDAHTDSQAPDALDIPALAALEAAPALGEEAAGDGWSKTFDMTHFVLSIWFPNPGPSGDNGQASLWPNSPPLPQPTASDGVCEPSRGENVDTAPADCTPHCGNGVREPDEDNQRCPSDVPAYTRPTAADHKP